MTTSQGSNRELALITGASSGIGAELARQFAAQKVNLILTARRRDRLEALAAELTARHGIKAAVIPADLSVADGPDRLIGQLGDKDHWPTILVNNAGFGYHGSFLKQTPEVIDALLEIHVRAATILCRSLGRTMAVRGHGAIMNVASFAAIAPIPRYAVYSGAKAYLVAFSQALRHELRPRGVKVSVLCPGFTKTEFHDAIGHKKSVLMRATELSVEQVARAGIRGLQRGRFLIVPGWWYKLNLLTARLAPRTLMSAMSGSVVKR